MLRRLSMILCTISLLAALTIALVGCGGSSNATTPGQGGDPNPNRSMGSASFLITWPERTRLIPVAANSIKISFDGPTPNEQIVPRPASGTNTSEVTFSNLVVGNYAITATAYPTSNATGTAQAMGSGQVTVVKDQTVETGVTMASTITQVSIAPTGPTIVAGTTGMLTGSATNAGNAVVLTTNTKWTWSSSNTAVATVTSNTNPVTVTAIAAGTTTITGTETESGKSTSTTVTVIPNTGDLDLTIK
jgi:hypothetical protein